MRREGIKTLARQEGLRVVVWLTQWQEGREVRVQVWRMGRVG